MPFDRWSEGIGPTFKGLYGRSDKLTDGSTVTVNDAYMRETIVKPEAKVVAGIRAGNAKTELSEEEIDDIIEYLRNVK